MKREFVQLILQRAERLESRKYLEELGVEYYCPG